MKNNPSLNFNTGIELTTFQDIKYWVPALNRGFFFEAFIEDKKQQRQSQKSYKKTRDKIQMQFKLCVRRSSASASKMFKELILFVSFMVLLFAAGKLSFYLND